MPKSISKTPKESSFKKRLHSIIEDRTSGAAEIEMKILRLFEDLLAENRDDARIRLRKAIDKLKNRFSAMANILSLTIFVESLMDSKEPDFITESIKEYKNKIEQNRGITIKRTARRIKAYGSIFTLSGSSLVLRAIFEAIKLGWKGKIGIVESRPKNEGVEFAKKAAGAGIRTVLGVDAQMPYLIRETGAVFLGADAVTESYFVNKIGSDIAVEYAVKYGKPVYVISDGSKFISNKIYKFIPDRNPGREIIPKRIINLEIINNYFEKIIPRGKVHFISGGRIIPAQNIEKFVESQSFDS